MRTQCRPPFESFPLEIRARLGVIRAESNKRILAFPSVRMEADVVRVDRWLADKGQFPDRLKPFLKAAGIAAMRHDMFGEREEANSFYMCLPSTLPYNRLTLTVSLRAVIAKEADDDLRNSLRSYAMTSTGTSCKNVRTSGSWSSVSW